MKQTNQTGEVWVEVSLSLPFYITNRASIEEQVKEGKKIGEEVEAQIRRHIDHVSQVRVVVETKDVCSHCGYPWTGYRYNGCCDADLDEAEEKGYKKRDA